MPKSKLKFGYLKHKGSGIGGRSIMRKVHHLEKVGLTNENCEFGVEGRPKEVIEWLQNNENIEISGPDREGCDMYILRWKPKSAGAMYLESFASNVLKGGGLMCRLINHRYRRLRITFIEKGGTHRAGERVRVPEETTLGEVFEFLESGSFEADDDSDDGSYSYSS